MDREPKYYTGGFKKCFWLLVMMGMAAALTYNVVELTKKYLSYPISVKLSVEHQQQLTFPSVTVCNMSPIKKSAWQAAQNEEVKRRRKRAIGKAYQCWVTKVTRYCNAIAALWAVCNIVIEV